MATGAVQIIPVIEDGSLRLELRRFFVAFRAGYGDVPTGEGEVSLLVFGQGEGRWLIAFERMATIASVEVRGCGKLSRVPIAVAIGAMIEFDFEQGVLPFRDMTLSAFQSGMPTLQRIGGRGVLFHREPGRLPPLHGVAGSALPTTDTLRELPLVWIGLVAVHALGKYQRLFEVAIGVALRAIYRRVLSFQRELRPGMIKALTHLLQGDFLPPGGVVTRLAALRETAMVRILVAIGTLRKRDTAVLRLTVRSARVALRTLHLRVQPG